MGLFDGKKDDKTAAAVANTPVVNPVPVQPVSVAKPEVKSKKNARSIPKSVIKHFSEEEKALYTKDIKRLTSDEVKALTKIKMKIVSLQGRILQRKLDKKINVKVSDKKISYAKCIFAEEILKKNPELLRQIQDKEYSSSGAAGLEALSKIHKLDLKFKVKAKVEKNKTN